MPKKVPMADVFETEKIETSRSKTKKITIENKAQSAKKQGKGSTARSPRPKVKKISITHDRPGQPNSGSFPYTFELTREMKSALDKYTETFGMTPQETVNQGLKVIIKLGPLGGMKPLKGYIKHISDKSPLTALLRENIIEASKILQQKYPRKTGA